MISGLFYHLFQHKHNPPLIIHDAHMRIECPLLAWSTVIALLDVLCSKGREVFKEYWILCLRWCFGNETILLNIIILPQMLAALR